MIPLIRPRGGRTKLRENATSRSSNSSRKLTKEVFNCMDVILIYHAPCTKIKQTFIIISISKLYLVSEITVALHDVTAPKLKGNISIKPLANQNRNWVEGVRRLYRYYSERAEVKSVHRIPFFIFALPVHMFQDMRFVSGGREAAAAAGRHGCGVQTHRRGGGRDSLCLPVWYEMTCDHCSRRRRRRSPPPHSFLPFLTGVSSQYLAPQRSTPTSHDFPRYDENGGRWWHIHKLQGFLTD